MLTLLLKLAATPSLNDKKKIIADFDGDTVKKIYQYALDPFKVFGIKQIPELSHHNYDLVDNFEGMFNLLDKYLSRELTGNAAKDAAQKFMQDVDPDTYEVFKRIINKDLRCGTGAKLVNKVFPDLIPSFELMAADKYEKKRARFPAVVEPKLDGMRCIYFIEDEITCFSRGGKPIETLDKITEEVKQLYPKGTVLDGELITPDGFNDAMSIIKRKKDNVKPGDIFFNIFDVLTIEEFTTQTCKVSYLDRKVRIHQDRNKPQFVKVVPFYPVANEEDLMLHYASFIEKGYPYEGAMFKDPISPYEFKRSKAWMKVKPSDNVDLVIIGAFEGEGKYRKKLGGFYVDYKGVAVSIGGGFSDAQREEFWAKKDEMLSSLIEVEYMEETADGSLRHPRFIRIRSYKGEKV